MPIIPVVPAPRYRDARGAIRFLVRDAEGITGSVGSYRPEV